ncbi:hypothetical protein [Streptomyces djakartensis]|uniref:Uncharacterized protein n=1 Tax=Streptomyces djakartensis TaxID=68193 RepID=A0ABQ3A7G9_9ACTN|nr:hypothetical protein [Streptomyces djakartensis]GGY35056.1 hypothetical protein GCM10010384_47630 [Streptomyces djakartensis]
MTIMPTGASDAGCIESYAENPVHWVTVRRPEVVGTGKSTGRGRLADRRRLDAQYLGDSNRRAGRWGARPYTLTAPALRTGKGAVQVCQEA